MTLVDKDQVEILQSLRESVSIEKNALETELSRLRSELRTSEDRVKMQMEQVNSLLLEKVELQTEGIGQREKMLERERKLGELRASLAGKELPEEARELMTRLQEARNKAEADAKVSHDKLGKAKLVSVSFCFALRFCID